MSPSSRNSRNRRLLVTQLTSNVGETMEASLAEVDAQLEGRAVAPEDFPPVVETAGLATVQRLLRGRQALTWVFTGDHLCQGGVFTAGSRSFPEHFAERLRCELRRYLDVVIGTGLSGDQADSLLRRLKLRALRFRPDVVSVSLGMNDSKAGPAGRERFRANLREVLDRLRTAGAVPVLHTPNGVHLPAAENRVDLPAYAAILCEEAARMDLPVIDHFAHWQRLHAEPGAVLDWLGDGRIQPNHAGHRAIARLTFHHFGIFDLRSPTCR